MIPIYPGRRSHFDRADFFHRPLRTDVVFSDKEYNGLNKFERMSQQQLFHFAVVPPAPIFSREKRPSNFNLRFFRIIPVKSRRADDLSRLRIDHNKRSPGFQRVFEENSEYIFLVAITLRMLFLDRPKNLHGT